MNKFDQKMCDLAIQLAKTSEHQIRVGAVLVSGRDIVSVGVNTLKSHPYQKQYNQLRGFNVEIHHHSHAETEAIIKYRRMRIELPKLKIIVARIHKNGNIVPGFPCPACQQMILDNGINDVICSQHTGFIEVNI